MAGVDLKKLCRQNAMTNELLNDYLAITNIERRNRDSQDVVLKGGAFDSERNPSLSSDYIMSNNNARGLGPANCKPARLLQMPQNALDAFKGGRQSPLAE